MLSLTAIDNDTDFGSIRSVLKMENLTMRRMSSYRIAIVLVIVAACGLLTGCGKKETQGESGGLMVLCGSSFVMPMEKLCAEFTDETGIKTATSVGGSEDLLPHVKLAAKGDAGGGAVE